MAYFTCSRCGKCCQSFGPYLRIERELEEGRYYCHCSLSGEYFYAQRTGARDDNPVEKVPAEGKPFPCPFLYREEDGIYTCTIYPTRPAFCRQFRCSHMDILDLEGNQLGKVGGKRSLISADPGLRDLWKKEIESISEKNDVLWRETIKKILERNRYRVVLYD